VSSLVEFKGEERTSFSDCDPVEVVCDTNGLHDKCTRAFGKYTRVKENYMLYFWPISSYTKSSHIRESADNRSRRIRRGVELGNNFHAPQLGQIQLDAG
jgi:hypothetical protein